MPDNWDRDHDDGRRRPPESNRGNRRPEDRPGYGRDPGYEDRFQADSRRQGAERGSAGDGSPGGYGGDTGRGYGQPEPQYREGPGQYRPGPGARFGGPGVGYREARDPRFPEHDHGGYDRRDHEDRRGFLDRAADEVQSWFGNDEADRRRRTDERDGVGVFGEHRGRGPRNYTRSDDRVRDDINDRLSDDPHLDASDVEVAVAQGEVTLSGTVRDRFAKRHAEDIADRVSGVKHVQNNLRVQPQSGGPTATEGAAPSASSGTAGAGIGVPGTMSRTV